MLVSLPILLLLLDQAGLHSRWRGCWPRRRRTSLLALASCLVTFLVQRGTAMHTHDGPAPGLRLLNAVKSPAGAYLGKAVSSIHLSAFYLFPASDSYLGAPSVGRRPPRILAISGGSVRWRP